jgi:PAS domain-containing protein
MVALAYFLIPLLLLDCLQWRPNLLDQGIFWLLCAFFITGGMTHFMQEQRQVETERRESNQRLSLLVKQTPLAVIEWTINFEVADWNPAAEKIFGYSKREALGSHAVKLMVPEKCQEACEPSLAAVVVTTRWDTQCQ